MTFGALTAALALDLAVGDPDGPWHPVRRMGALLARGEAWARGRGNHLRLRGIAVLAAAVLLSWGAGYGLLRAARWADAAAGWGGWLEFAAQVLMVWSCIGVRSMVDHAVAVLAALELGELGLARAAVARMVGRDTAALDPDGVCRACLESVAEGLGDGVVAPLLFAAVGGGPLALAYRAANTADSQLGHRDEAYRELGWASARFDDLLNWIPARKAMACAVIAALALRLKASAALRVAREDGPKQPSPNSGWPEGAFAGALEVRLGGPLFYRGVRVDKAWLGPDIRPLSPALCRRGVTLFLTATLVCVAILELLAWFRPHWPLGLS